MYSNKDSFIFQEAAAITGDVLASMPEEPMSYYNGNGSVNMWND